MNLSTTTYALMICGLLSTSSTALAAWASGGGKIHRDALNPWFLENTKVVRYCIDMDDAHFGLDRSAVEIEVRAALAEWKEILTESQDDIYEAGDLVPYGQIRIGTQRFEEQSCADADAIDLFFQFGTLRQEQRQLFDNPREFVGIAARTDYDKENLRGKGFVYLAPMSGPLAPIQSDLNPDAWTTRSGFAFRTVLRHELGHVFGVNHQPNTLMDEQLPERLVSRKLLPEIDAMTYRYFESTYSIRRLFGLKKVWTVEGCGIRNPVWAPWLFNTAYGDEACGRIKLIDGQLTIEFTQQSGLPYELIGSAQIADVHTNSTPAITVYLPEDQRVFSKVPRHNFEENRLYGHSLNTLTRGQGLLQVHRTGAILHLQIQTGVGQSGATVLLNNKFENDVFFLD